MKKPLLLTMTQERCDDISQMISNIYPTFDGIVALVNQPSNDGTFELLEKNKGNGKILKQQFTPHHGFLMNHLLFYGDIEDGRYCVYLDSPERMTDYFIKNLPDLLNKFEDEHIGALYWDGRPYIFKYSPYLEFHNAVHWALTGINTNIITLPDKDKYIINTRKDNPSISFCKNGAKYFVCYPLSNDVYSTYIKYGKDIVEKKETERRAIRKYLKDILKLDLLTLDGIIQYMRRVENKEVVPNDYFINAVENNFRLSELYQLCVLGFDFMNVIAKKRHEWSFQEHLSTGNGWKEGYMGEINRLNQQFGYTLE